MVRNALRLMRRDPETLLFTLATMALLLTPLLLVVGAGLAALPADAPQGPLALAMAPALQLLRFAAFTGLGQAFGYSCIVAAAFFSFLVGGLMTCAILDCAIKRLRGEEPSALGGLSAMWRTAPRILPFALAGLSDGLSGSPASEAMVSPAVSLALAVMVDQDVDFPEALRRAQSLEDVETLRLGGIDASTTAWLGAIMVAGWAYGIYLGAGADTTVGVMGPMFGIPIALLIVFGSLIATVQVIMLAALYMRAMRHEKGVQSYVDVYFPPES